MIAGIVEDRDIAEGRDPGLPRPRAQGGLHLRDAVDAGSRHGGEIDADAVALEMRRAAVAIRQMKCDRARGGTLAGGQAVAKNDMGGRQGRVAGAGMRALAS